jgi:hypothetical protein
MLVMVNPRHNIGNRATLDSVNDDDDVPGRFRTVCPTCECVLDVELIETEYGLKLCQRCPGCDLLVFCPDPFSG